jgi:hypothetical protein
MAQTRQKKRRIIPVWISEQLLNTLLSVCNNKYRNIQECLDEEEVRRRSLKTTKPMKYRDTTSPNII